MPNLLTVRQDADDHRSGRGLRNLCRRIYVVIYEISKDALSPLLKARASMTEELSESLASRQLARRTVLDHNHYKEQHEERLADRVAANIRRLFSLH